MVTTFITQTIHCDKTKGKQTDCTHMHLYTDTKYRNKSFTLIKELLPCLHIF